MKYIDVERLKEKIDKVRQDWLGDSTGLEVGESGAELGAAESILDSIDEIIDSLHQEQPGVDLDRKFAREYATYSLPSFIIASLADGTELIDFIYKTARHFYECGINAIKEENK